MSSSICFFFNDTATTEIYTLSLHDALPICQILGRQSPLHHEEVRAPVAEALHQTEPEHDVEPLHGHRVVRRARICPDVEKLRLAYGLLQTGEAAHVYKAEDHEDRKSTRLNSSHANISYAVFCL